MSRLTLSAVVVAAVVATTAPAPARASITETYDKLAYLTFNGPVQIPGGTLSAGTSIDSISRTPKRAETCCKSSAMTARSFTMFHTRPTAVSQLLTRSSASGNASRRGSRDRRSSMGVILGTSSYAPRVDPYVPLVRPQPGSRIRRCRRLLFPKRQLRRPNQRSSSRQNRCQR